MIRACLGKLELGFLTYSLISPLPKTLGPNYLELAFRSQTPNVTALRSKISFHAKFRKILLEKAFIFKFLVNFDKV